MSSFSEVAPLSEVARIDDAPWTVDDAAELYQVDVWSDGFFRVLPNGEAAATPLGTPDAQISLPAVLNHLKKEGLSAPVLLRFPDVIHGRVQQLNEAFKTAIAETAYEAPYTTVYPIKVNQLHQVVEEILEAGQPYNLGLECGSKAELVAALSHLESDDRLLICNGYKDASMLRLIVEAQALGKEVIPVIEEYSEFEELLRVAQAKGIAPRMGARVNLSAAGVGQWASSCGDRSKFGLEIIEVLRMLDRLDEEGMPEAFDLVHFHIGSQISDIQALKRGVREIAQVYAELHRRGTTVRYLDVGGGLGIRYEPNTPGALQTINYTTQEYANAVVGVVHEVCAQAGVPVPHLLSESGRALTAHHAVLVVEALSVQRHSGIEQGWTGGADDHMLVQNLSNTLAWVTELAETVPAADPPLSELVEAFHDAQETREQASQLFAMGYVPLEQKARATQLYWTICRAIHRIIQPVDPQVLPQELHELDHLLTERYLCGFSVFQSILDHWAIGQLFPVMPLQRLDEEPTRRAELVDLTCDSDGKISTYISEDGPQPYLKAHPLDASAPYYFGIFLTGAYQDIMGDMHNLFGRLPEVHLYADDEEPEGYYIEKRIPGSTVGEMLGNVQYFAPELQRRMKGITKAKVEEGVLRAKDAVPVLEHYREMFAKSTYVNRHEL